MRQNHRPGYKLFVDYPTTTDVKLPNRNRLIDQNQIADVYSLKETSRKRHGNANAAMGCSLPQYVASMYCYAIGRNTQSIRHRGIIKCRAMVPVHCYDMKTAKWCRFPDAAVYDNTRADLIIAPEDREDLPF